MFLPVKVKFNNRGPAAYIRSGERVTRLDESTIGMLDEIDIQSVSCDVRPYDWDVNGKTGRTAYLQAIDVIQMVDRFGDRYAQEGKFQVNTGLTSLIQKVTNKEEIKMKEKMLQVKEYVIAHKKQVIIGGAAIIAGVIFAKPLIKKLKAVLIDIRNIYVIFMS